MSNACSKCGRDNRPGSRFCAVCGGPLAAAQPLTPPTISATAQPAVAHAPASLSPAMTKAGAAIAPVARQAAARGWAESKRGMSLLARIFTIGGRAAYSEVFGPLPIVSGQVAGRPNEAAVSEPVESAAIAFMLAFLGGGLVLALPPAIKGIFVIAAPMTLLVLAWLGLRRPYFTMMTFTALLQRLRNRGASRQIPIYRFQIFEHATGQPIDAVMVGPRQGNPVNLGANVHLWGIRHPASNEIRVWRAETVDAAGLSLGVLSAPRLMPLTVALFLPAAITLAIWLLTLLV